MSNEDVYAHLYITKEMEENVCVCGVCVSGPNSANVFTKESPKKQNKIK